MTVKPEIVLDVQKTASLVVMINIAINAKMDMDMKMVTIKIDALNVKITIACFVTPIQIHVLNAGLVMD